LTPAIQARGECPKGRKASVKYRKQYFNSVCPKCAAEFEVRSLPYQGLFADYRLCPNCGLKITADKDTKYRQVYCLVIAVFSLMFTILLYFDGATWLLASIASYVVLAGIIVWGSRKMYFVPYTREESEENGN